MLLAVGLTSVGAVIVVAGDDETLGFTFKALYMIGCIAAVLAVRRRALFTAVAQPPLVLFGVAVITLYFLVSASDSGLKKLVFNVALPVAKLFPLMGWTFFIVLAIAAARVWLTHPKNAGMIVKTGDRKTGDRKVSASRSPKKSTAKTAPRSADQSRKASGKPATDKARSDKPRSDKARSGATKAPRPQPRPAVLDGDGSVPPAVPRPRVNQPPRPPLRATDPRPRASEPRIPERDDLGGPPPRRRRAAPEIPEPRPRRAAPYDDRQPPPPAGARAYRAPEEIIYAPPPRIRDRDLR